MIALAASQARAHAEMVAVTDIGPGTVEQFRADVVRLGRAYVSSPPLLLFAAMHRAPGKITASPDESVPRRRLSRGKVLSDGLRSSLAAQAFEDSECRQLKHDASQQPIWQGRCSGDQGRDAES